MDDINMDSYLGMKEVSDTLGEKTSTIRYWCASYEDYLCLERVGRNRKFKDSDVEKLRYIQSLLREKGMSIEQVANELKKSTMEVSKDVQNKEPLGIESLALAFAKETENILNEFTKQQEVKRLEDIEKLTSLVISEVSSMVTETLDRQGDTFKFDTNSILGKISRVNENSDKSYKLLQDKVELLEKELEARENRYLDMAKKSEERDIALTNLLKKSLESKEEPKKTGVWGRIFSNKDK